MDNSPSRLGAPLLCAFPPSGEQSAASGRADSGYAWRRLSRSGAFVVCWTPGLVVLLLDGLNCTRCEVQNVKRWFLLLALLNSVMNPIIYSYKDDEMSSTMRRMICCITEEKNQERRSSRIPSTVLSRSMDSSSQYLENGISQGTICSKAST